MTIIELLERKVAAARAAYERHWNECGDQTELCVTCANITDAIHLYDERLSRARAEERV